MRKKKVSLVPSVIAALHRSNVPVVMTLHNYRMVCVNALVFRDGDEVLHTGKRCARGSLSGLRAVCVGALRRRCLGRRRIEAHLDIRDAGDFANRRANVFR